MYHVEIDYWNGGTEQVTGEPVSFAKALEIKQKLQIESISGEYFVNIIHLGGDSND